MNIDHMGLHVNGFELQVADLALLHHALQLFLIRVDPQHVLFEGVWHDFLVADLTLNFTFLLALLGGVVASVVPLHGLLLEDLPADLARGLQESLLLGRQVCVGLVVFIELRWLKNLSANEAVGRFVKFLRLVLALHMPLQRSRIQLLVTDLALRLDLVYVEEMGLLLVLEHHLVADPALNFIAGHISCICSIFVFGNLVAFIGSGGLFINVLWERTLEFRLYRLVLLIDSPIWFGDWLCLIELVVRLLCMSMGASFSGTILVVRFFLERFNFRGLIRLFWDNSYFIR